MKSNYQVKNAIILAAGRGSRLKHLTSNTPKPLLAPKGIPFIEAIINNLKEKGINEVYVVVGYLKEQFRYLEEKFGVKLIENKIWNKGNNITSIYAASHVLDNTLIINGDIIMKENVIQTQYPYSLTYAESNEDIDEWIVEIDKDEQVLNFNKEGLGKKGLYQREIIFITREIAQEIEKQKENFDIEEYQEYMMLTISKQKGIPFKVMEIPKNTIFDLDTVEEFEDYSKSA
ncbi:NTP transferase domain-containing protein [Mycoplasma marinum]|uniref:MobA-like NTP transferase domain-containing protein n=1 Tax=Mycoplasma marinum TaxID=1937190 RepID=A0A4R0XUW3_9MOLU|nr:NTP transferase domain-containing protein [Mycoplasma marinum]TCG11489.1 hypothetical protein C4B24_01895 [Mycoplasma marinum]